MNFLYRPNGLIIWICGRARLLLPVIIRFPCGVREHLDAMRPLMKMLADAGQKIITATLTHKPWNGQTEDYFDTMVTWMKRADGTWAFDYTVFDRWVEFMMSVGIDKQINCYSMVPWELSFQYFDQATNSLQFVKTAPGNLLMKRYGLPCLLPSPSI